MCQSFNDECSSTRNTDAQSNLYIVIKQGNTYFNGSTIQCNCDQYTSNWCTFFMSAIKYTLCILDFNIANTFSLLKLKDLTETKYGLYYVVFNLRMIAIMLHKYTMPFYRAFQSLPQIPRLFYDSFTLKNMLVSEPN